MNGGEESKDVLENATPNPETDFEYELVESNNDNVIITKYVGDAVNVVIPETIGGKNVAVIGSAAFGESNIETVYMPDTVTSIAGSAFALCKDLKTVRFSANTKYIQENAFYECTALSDVNMPDTVTFIGEKAFYGCSSLKEALLPKSLERLENRAFENCTALEKLSIPAKLCNTGKFNGECFFMGCFSLKEVTFEEGTEQIPEMYGAFFNCNALKELTIPAGVKSMWSISAKAPELEKVTFLGDAPEFVGESSFFSESTKVYYDPETKGWDELGIKDEYNFLPNE